MASMAFDYTGRQLQQAGMGMCMADYGTSAGYSFWYQQFNNTGIAVCTEVDNAPWLDYFGNHTQAQLANVMQWVALATCVVNLLFYAYHFFHKETGWEEVYVCCVELAKVSLEVRYEFNNPMVVYLSTGNYVPYGRYAEWLLCCPVILIHMSNITGLNHEYGKRTMALLVSDLGCIVMGVTAAMSDTTIPKWVFFTLGCLLGCITYYNAFVVYREAFYECPVGVCRNLVFTMATCYYMAWSAFPLLFALGPEGSKVMNYYTSNAVHSFVDIMAKQFWGLLGHILRIKVRQHVAKNGPLATRQSKTLAAAIAAHNRANSATAPGMLAAPSAAEAEKKLAEKKLAEEEQDYGNRVVPVGWNNAQLEVVDLAQP